MRTDVGLKLGSLVLEVPFFQASLSGYSDYAMRALARRFGCPFTMADMILDTSAAHPRVLRKARFRPADDEHPIGAQIVGTTPMTMAKAARDLIAVGYDVIDLNFACPAPKVLRRGRGGALLNHPGTVIDIIKAVRDCVAVPLLVKLRIGVDHTPRSLENFWEIVTGAIEQGSDAVVIHGRTVAERYKGKADWDVPTAVKKRFPGATVVGSGDIFDAAATVALMERTGLDGFIVARGAFGNPWIYRDLRCVWKNRPVPPPPELTEQQAVMLDHFRAVLALYPPKKAVGEFRKFGVCYARRHPRRKPALLALMKAKAPADVEAAIRIWFTDDYPGRDGNAR